MTAIAVGPARRYQRDKCGNCGKFRSVGRHSCGRPPVGEVPLEALREAFQRSGLLCNEVATRAGMDWTYVNRLLNGVGYYSYKRGQKYGPYQFRATSYEVALKLADALGVDPHEVGL